MTKILYVPESRYLMLIHHSDSLGLSESTSFYGSVVAKGIEVSANDFIALMCNADGNEAWDGFKRYQGISMPCRKEEFEVIDD